MKKLFNTAIAVSGLLLSTSLGAQAQTWNIPAATTTTGTHFGINNSFDLPIFTNSLERMRITAAGKIGIGTTTPAVNLHIHGLAGNYPVPAYAPIEMLRITAPNSTGLLMLGVDVDGNALTQGSNFILKSMKTIVHSGGLGLPGTLPDNYYFGVTAGGSWFKESVRIGNTSPNPSLIGSCQLGVEGKVIIGSPNLATPSGYLLYVEDGILTEQVKVAVESTSNWSDFVFDKSYKLMPLADVEKFIDENKHLPDVPCAEEMVENGLDVATMDAKLLQKIEELTLYLIDQQKQIEEMKKKNLELEQKLIKATEN